MEASNRRAGIVFGTVLIVFGALILVGQMLDFVDWGGMWPLISVGIGVLFFVSMFLGGKATAALAVPGAIFTGIGLILFVQDLADAWETWAYAWGLIIASVGAGLYIFGAYGGNQGLKEAGWTVSKVGLILFLVFGFIFEVVFSLTGIGEATGSLFFPIAIGLVGLVLLVVRSVRLVRSPETVKGDDRDLFWPVMFIGIGLMWVFVSQGWLSQREALSVLNLWPVLLIAVGLEILLGRRRPWVGALVGAVVVAGMFWFAFNASQYGLPQRFSWLNLPFNVANLDVEVERVVGSGNLESETRPVSGFSRLDFAAAGVLEMTQGDTESLVIEADDNVLPYITTEVRAGKLVIAFKPRIGFYSISDIRYTLVVKELEELEISGAGKLNMASLKTDNLKLDASGAASFNLQELQAEGLDVDLSGAGSLTVAGAVEKLIVDLSGAGNFNGQDLQSQTAQVDISGIGSANVWVTEELNAEITGIGSINYFGSPSVSKEVTGLGNLVSKGDK